MKPKPNKNLRLPWTLQGEKGYRSTRLRANSPTTCQLAYVGEFTQVMYAFHHFVNNVQNAFAFGSALDERTRNTLYGVKCWVHILKFI